MFDMYGDSRENLLEILAVIISFSPITSVRGISFSIYVRLVHGKYISLFVASLCVFVSFFSCVQVSFGMLSVFDMIDILEVSWCDGKYISLFGGSFCVYVGFFYMYRSLLACLAALT